MQLKHRSVCGAADVLNMHRKDDMMPRGLGRLPEVHLV
jgi:hypothetical protein